MEKFDAFLGNLATTARGKALLALGGLYASIEASQSAFKRAFPADRVPSRAGAGSALDCPEGCGSCCEGFVPDLLPLEAEYMAAWLLREGKAPLPPPALSATGGCPFHRPDDPRGQCGIYPVRPLVCRLFAATPSRGAAGELAFSLCRHLPSLPGRGSRTWAGGELESRLEPPARLSMDAFGASLAALSPDEAGDRRPLPEALDRALRRIGLLVSLGRAATAPDPVRAEPRAAGDPLVVS